MGGKKIINTIKFMLVTASILPLLALQKAPPTHPVLSFQIVQPGKDQPIIIAMDQDLVDQMEIMSINPEPIKIRKAGTMYVYEFSQNNTDPIEFEYKTNNISDATIATISYNSLALKHAWQN